MMMKFIRYIYEVISQIEVNSAPGTSLCNIGSGVDGYTGDLTDSLQLLAVALRVCIDRFGALSYQQESHQKNGCWCWIELDTKWLSHCSEQ